MFAAHRLSFNYEIEETGRLPRTWIASPSARHDGFRRHGEARKRRSNPTFGLR